MAKTKPYSVIVLPDMQVPYQDDRTLAAVEQYMSDQRFDECVNLGDFLDFDVIGKYNVGKPRLTEGKTIEDYYDQGNAILDRQLAILRKRNPSAKYVLLEGNHEYRIEAYLDEHPELRRKVEVAGGLCLEKRKIRFVRCYAKGELYKVGKAYFHHGLYCSANHAKKMVDNFGVNVFYGHTHDIMLHSKVQWGKDKTLVGQSMGCLCGEQDYMRGRPSNWAQAFGIFHFMPGGYFTYYVVRIFDHAFVAPNGTIYQG